MQVQVGGAVVNAPAVPQTTAAFTGSAATPRIVTMVAVRRPVAPAATALDLDVLNLGLKEIDLLFETVEGRSPMSATEDLR